MQQETANKLVVLSVLQKMVKTLDADLRATVEHENVLEPGDRKTAKAAGRTIGYALRTDPQEQNRVTDRAAFIAWVRENHPDEIELIYTIRSSFEGAVVERGCDEAGEAIPGVGPVKGRPTLVVKPAGDAEAAIRAELAAHGMSFAKVLEQLSARGEGL